MATIPTVFRRPAERGRSSPFSTRVAPGVRRTRLGGSKKVTATHGELIGETMSFIDRVVADVQHGTFERSLSGLTALAATITTAEIFIEHYSASFGNRWMWSPIIVTPPVVVAGVMGIFSRRWAKTVLPIASLVYSANGLLGEYFHARGVARRPGGWGLASYNVPMGPPIAAPGLMLLVGGMGILAALLRREAE